MSPLESRNLRLDVLNARLWVLRNHLFRVRIDGLDQQQNTNASSAWGASYVFVEVAGTLLSRNNFVYEAKPLRVKLNDRKVRWLIQEKRKGRGSGELALIQKVTRRRVEQL